VKKEQSLITQRNNLRSLISKYKKMPSKAHLLAKHTKRLEEVQKLIDDETTTTE